MTVTVYNTPTGTEHMRKEISSVVGTYTGAVRDSIVIERPIILLNATLATGNYCYIPDFGRYYYIRAKNVMRDGLTEIQCEVDVLMSYQTQILGCKCICEQRVTRESADRYIPNSGYKTRIYRIMGSMDDITIGTENRGLPFDDQYILVGMYG